MRSCFARGLWTAIFALALLPAKFAPAQHPPYRIIYPEQLTIAYRDPSQFFPAPLPPSGPPLDQYRLFTGVTKNNPLGGKWNLGVNVLDQRFPHSILPPSLLPLNPQSTANASLSYTQPLLQGAGMRANLAPVLLARINTELSYFQLKDATQQNVHDVIAGYWNLVAARA